jgi:RHS repeat-associated protein
MSAQGYGILIYPPKSLKINLQQVYYNDLFSLELNYNNPVAANTPAGVTATPQYGGNISQATWQVRGREKQSYTFKYDHINRLTEARYADISTVGTVAASDRYSELLTYDTRGNIKTLQRYGKNNTTCSWGLIDNLTYQYDPYETTYNPSNKLYKVTDASDLTRGFKTVSSGSLYSYDNNGNMTADPNKGITNIVYNHLNLPTSITFTGNKTIAFLYDAGGNKLRKTVVDNGVTQYAQDYVGGIEYRNSVLESIFHSEGRITNINSTLKYEYALKDHLGNTRIMFSDINGNGIVTQGLLPSSTTNEVTQENHFYAFGMNMESVWVNNASIVDNRYQYNGKELNEDFGLNWNDYGARMYDATLGRWNAVDPMADAYQAYSPYVYVLNNPIRLIDPNGMYSEDPTASRNTGIATPDGIVGGAGSYTTNPNGQRAKFEAKFAKKIGSVLQKLHGSGASPAQIQSRANQLAKKYQNKDWFRYFVNGGGSDVGGAQTSEKNGRSSSTGWKRDETISIDPYPAATTVNVRTRDGSATQANNNSPIATGLTAENGAILTAVFTPKSQPDALTVFGIDVNGNISPPILSSGGEVRSTDIAQRQAYTYTSTVNSAGSLFISVTVSNTRQTINNPDRWDLQITVQNPFTTDPYKIVHSNVKAHAD